MEPYRTLRLGGIGSLGVLIRLTKLIAPQPHAAFPPWEGMQYMRDMFSGHAKLKPRENDRYADIRWTTLRSLMSDRVRHLRMGCT